jgi:hypothetical protein
MTESLTYNTLLDRYLLVGLAPGDSSGRLPTGVYFSLSTDLIHWTKRKLILPTPTVNSYRCDGPEPIGYPSLIDPRSHSRTFATTGKRPYMYFTRYHYSDCHKTSDRDLVRVRMRVSPR